MPRTVSYTIQAVTAAELTGINITRQTDGQGGTVLIATDSFEEKDGSGNLVGHGSVSVQLTSGQRTSIANFATSVLVPAFNLQEGL